VPRISLVVAMAQNRVIGLNNRLPWRLPADLRYFRRITLGKPIVMGRKTFESIGKPLDGRTNIVVTRDLRYQASGCVVVHSLTDALRAAGGATEIMIIGGANIYAQALPVANRIYLTSIHHDIDGDTRFPELDPAAWDEIERNDHAPDPQNPYHYSFRILQRPQ
jgi:dihydrofolate reductase